MAACEYDGTDASSDVLPYLILFDAAVVRIWRVNVVRNVGNSAVVVVSVVLTVENRTVSFVMDTSDDVDVGTSL